MARITKQEYIVTSPFDERMTIEALKSQLASQIFRDVIKHEKAGIKLTFLIETIEDENDLCSYET